ncbi:MAG: hypothetical protein INR71_05140 [Terriglobus roseus]|nr:hypothetical protein [Terriglobus roseus]
MLEQPAKRELKIIEGAIGADTGQLLGSLNNGLIELNPMLPGAEMAVVIIGLGRSGTSMVARLLDAAGIPMGTRKDSRTYEDNDFVEAMRDGGPGDMQRLIMQRGTEHRRWGFKTTSGIGIGPLNTVVIPHGRMIVMVRDPIAVASRHAIEHATEATDDLSSFAHGVAMTLDWALSQTMPVLMVSYEKAITGPAAFLERLWRFCGIFDDPASYLSLVRPGHPEYFGRTPKDGR